MEVSTIRSGAAIARTYVQRLPRMLILSADLGSGHDALAGALARELISNGSAQAVVRNGLDDARHGAYQVMKRLMVGQVTHIPGSYGATYDVITRPEVTKVIRRAGDAVYGDGLSRLIAREDPDVVVSTFPMITSALGHLRGEGRVGVPVVGVVIDSDPHSMWFAAGIDSHIVLNPGDVPRAELLAIQEPALTGMSVRSARPAIDPRFVQRIDRVAARAAFGLPAQGPIVLATGGSLGLGLPPDDLARLAREANVTVAVATGHNQQLLQQLNSRSAATGVIGIPFTREMPTLLGAVDAVIANSGGMTAYESFAAGVPVIFHKPLPGHGADAARALQADGLAVYARTGGDLSRAARTLHGQASELDAAALAARDLYNQQPLSDAVLEVLSAAPVV